MYKPRYADGVIATKRMWTAKPLVAAVVVAVGFSAGLLMNRTPKGGTSAPALAGNEGDHLEHGEIKDPPLWAQIFRPSQATARVMLRFGLPMLSVVDGSAQEEEQGKQDLTLFFVGGAADKPQTPFQAVLPFLRPGEVAQGDTAPPAPPPPKTEPAPPENPGASEPPQQTPVQSPEKQPVNGGQFLIGIYHTHDWESYLSEFPSLKLQKPEDLNKVQSLDHKQKTVVDLGRELGEKLKALGVSTVHAPNTHQRLKYDYAYQLSRETAERILKEQPSVKILLDIHRDGAWGLDSTTTVNGQRVAQIRCIIGKLDEPHWEQNKAFCDSIVERVNKKYPGVGLPTKTSDYYTYNQDLLPGAVLFEIGNAPNSYTEAQRAVGYLAEALAEIAREGAYPK